MEVGERGSVREPKTAKQPGIKKKGTEKGQDRNRKARTGSESSMSQQLKSGDPTDQ